jgi:flagellar basal-body rod modification protein FlgD
MTTIQDTSNVTNLFGAGASSVAKSGKDETQDRFLSLLVAQMKNQDPLNPLDNAQVTSQLAQLSTVQGIEDMNSKLEALAASLGPNQMSQAANLIGHGVLVPGDTLSPAQLQDVMGFELSRPADSVTVSIQDGAGNLVRSLNLGPRDVGVNALAWDGLTDSGAAAAAGEYHFSVAAVQGGQPVSNTTLNLGMVNSVSQSGQGVQLNLAGNKSVGYADIRQIF